MRATAYDRDEEHVKFRPQKTSTIAAGQVNEIMAFKAAMDGTEESAERIVLFGLDSC